MEYISSWTKGLITIVVLSSFIELLMPKGDIKKYVRFASGLIIILMIIKPLIDIKSISLPKLESFNQEEYTANSVQEVYVERLEKNVEQALEIDKVEITVNPKRLTEILYVKSKVKKAEIARYLGLPPDKVGD